MLTTTFPLVALWLTGSISQAPDQLDLRIFDALAARSDRPGDQLDLTVLELAPPDANRLLLNRSAGDSPATSSPPQARPRETLDLRVLGVTAASATTATPASRTAAPPAASPGTVEAPGTAAAPTPVMPVVPATSAVPATVALPPWHRPGITYWHSTGEWKTVPQAGVVYQPPALWWQTSSGRVCINGQCR